MMRVDSANIGRRRARGLSSIKMIYPGNTSLSSEIQERIFGTFEQTLELAAQGSREEAALGCDFILRLDPDFRPAHLLNKRLESGADPVDIEDLRLGTDESDVESLFEKLPDDGLEHLDLSDPGATALVEKPESAGAPQAGDLRSRLQALISLRHFDELLRVAESEKEAIAANPELVALVEKARSRQGARPLLQTYAESARQALENGQLSEADSLIAKIKALDPDYPMLAELTELREKKLNDGDTKIISPDPSPFSDPYPDAEAPGNPGVDRAASNPPSPPASGSPDLGGEGDLFLDLDDEPVAADLLFEEPSKKPPPRTAPSTPPPAAPVPPTPPAPPATGVPTFGGEPESDRRIRALLDEGQESFDKADFQAAIDIWSRIFLIDIDHEEAAARIEEARRHKAEQERQVEEVFHDAVSQFEAGDGESAQGLFERVVQLNPNHLAARDYLEKIEQGEVAPGSGSLSVHPRNGGASPDSTLGSDADGASGLSAEILIPPDPSAVRAATPPRVQVGAGRSMIATVSPGSGGRAFVWIGSGVLAVVLIAGFFLFRNRDRFFPNASDDAASQERKVDPIDRATELHEAGKTAIAISQLRRLPPFDSRYEEAQALISQWEAGSAEEPEVFDDEEEALSAVDVARREELILNAREALDLGANLLTTEALLEAATLAPLSLDEVRMARDAEAGLEPLQRLVEMIRGGDWEFVLPELWRARELDPGNPDVNQLLVNVYFNLGVRNLQRGDPGAAAEHFAEALDLHPDDEQVRRHGLFADTYKSRRKDLLFQIYIKYLAFRST